MPGMVQVLHTFGSDMKYHIHSHALITFGGMSESGKWILPKYKKKLFKYRELRDKYRETFMDMLRESIEKGDMIPIGDIDVEGILEQIENKNWNVQSQAPTVDTKC